MWTFCYAISMVGQYIGLDKQARLVFYFISNFIMPAKGFADLAVFVITNNVRDVLFKPTSDGEGVDGVGAVTPELMPQMNVALRDEVLHYVTSGIVKTIEDMDNPRIAQRVGVCQMYFAS